jgi:hypothetical protein
MVYVRLGPDTTISNRDNLERTQKIAYVEIGCQCTVTYGTRRSPRYGVTSIRCPRWRQQPDALIEPTIVQPIGKRRAVAIEDPDRQQYEKNHVGTTQTTTK